MRSSNKPLLPSDAIGKTHEPSFASLDRNFGVDAQSGQCRLGFSRNWHMFAESRGGIWLNAIRNRSNSAADNWSTPPDSWPKFGRIRPAAGPELAELVRLRTKVGTIIWSNIRHTVLKRGPSQEWTYFDRLSLMFLGRTLHFPSAVYATHTSWVVLDTIEARRRLVESSAGGLLQRATPERLGGGIATEPLRSVRLTSAAPGKSMFNRLARKTRRSN